MNKKEKIEKIILIVENAIADNAEIDVEAVTVVTDFKGVERITKQVAEEVYKMFETITVEKQGGIRMDNQKSTAKERLEAEICDLQSEINNLKAENEKRLKANEDFATKHCYMKCDIAKTLVKDFAQKLKEKTGTSFDYYKHFQKVVLSEQIDELLKEYE